MKFFTTPNSKNIIATLRIVAIEKSELTFVNQMFLLLSRKLIKVVCVVKITLFFYGLIFLKFDNTN